MCDFCERGKSLAVSLEMIIDESTIAVTHGYDYDVQTEFVGINFCPHCGKSLEIYYPEQCSECGQTDDCKCYTINN